MEGEEVSLLDKLGFNWESQPETHMAFINQTAAISHGQSSHCKSMTRFIYFPQTNVFVVRCDTHTHTHIEPWRLGIVFWLCEMLWPVLHLLGRN